MAVSKKFLAVRNRFAKVQRMPGTHLSEKFMNFFCLNVQTSIRMLGNVINGFAGSLEQSYCHLSTTFATGIENINFEKRPIIYSTLKMFYQGDEPIFIIGPQLF